LSDELLRDDNAKMGANFRLELMGRLKGIAAIPYERFRPPLVRQH
jgi:hypothetical protein